jgi:hypothetical protein
MRASAAVLSALMLALVVGLGGYLGGRVFFAPPPLLDQGSVWSEVSWPFLRDGWPKGRAFRCASTYCGEDLFFYARIKMGLCDCALGVASDEDLERITDAPLLSRDVAPQGAGEPAQFAGMNGWLRAYQMPNGAALLVYGGGRNCNAFVGMASARSEVTPQARAALDKLLNGPQMKDWIASAQGFPKIH